MNKRLLLAMGLLVAIAIPVAATDTPLYPVSVDEYMQGELPRISRVYALDSQDNPGQIPIDPFERDGYRYEVHEITQSAQAFTEEEPHTETVTVESKNKEDLETLFEPEILYESPDGFTGVLTLDVASITAEATAYGNSSYTVSDTKTYPSLSTADIALLPKTVTKNGSTISLADVDWQEVNGLYTATAQYSKTVPTTYASKYGVTATYTGNLTREVQGETLYTVVYGGTAMEQEEVIIPPPADLVEEEPAQDTSMELWIICGICGVICIILLVRIINAVTHDKKGKRQTK